MSIKLANLFRFITGEPKIIDSTVSYTVYEDGTATRSVTYHYEKSKVVYSLK